LLNYTLQNNPFTALHPLVKIVFLGTTAAFAFMVSDMLILILYLFAVLAFIALYKIKFGQLAIIIKLFIAGIPALIILFILSYLWKEPSLKEGAIRGLVEGLRYSLRFLSLILANFIVVLSTDPREIFYAFRLLHIPDTISKIMAHVINLFPRLVQEIQAIVEAQTLRGMQWRNMWRPSQWLPFALPVILSTMRYSEQMAISIELRGGIELPPHTTAHLRKTDFAMLIGCAVALVYAIHSYVMPSN
jgi:energy-coupling factor transporter transmembrane protein EcfT